MRCLLVYAVSVMTPCEPDDKRTVGHLFVRCMIKPCSRLLQQTGSKGAASVGMGQSLAAARAEAQSSDDNPDQADLD